MFVEGFFVVFVRSASGESRGINLHISSILTVAQKQCFPTTKLTIGHTLKIQSRKKNARGALLSCRSRILTPSSLLPFFKIM